MNYSARTINDGVQRTALTIYTCDGGNGPGAWTFSGNFATLGANLSVGDNRIWPGGTGPAGSVTIASNAAVQTAQSATTTVSATGTYTLNNNCSVTGTQVTSFGQVALGSASMLGAAPGWITSVQGGSLATADTGTAIILGGLTVANAYVYLGSTLPSYPTLYVSGNVTLASTVVKVSVDGGSLTRCGQISASGTISIDNTDTLQAYTNQAAIPGEHKHTVLSAAGGLTAGGQWGAFIWTGVGNPVAGGPWTTEYLPDEFDLIGTVPNNG
jgi:hypothetical protein